MNRCDIVQLHSVDMKNTRTHIACRVTHSLSLCKHPRARKVIVSLLMTSLDGQHIRQSSLYQNI